MLPPHPLGPSVSGSIAIRGGGMNGNLQRRNSLELQD
jgi:hypothetical protein